MDDFDQIVSAAGGEHFPSDFLTDYELCECFATSNSCETFLVEKKPDNKKYVAKCYRKSEFGLNESEILQSLHYSGLPAFTGQYENDEYLCVVRDYIEGITLDCYVAQKDLNTAEVISIGVQLCDILIYLHRQNPPVIHRDIKPQNIIIDKDGKITLIDFGIARKYYEDSDHDTFIAATFWYAAPEQYGYAQSDIRSDIFSCCSVLQFAVTGAEESTAEIFPTKLAQILKKGRSLVPRARYQTAEQLKKALLSVQKKQHTTELYLILLFSITALSFFCGILISPLLLSKKAGANQPDSVSVSLSLSNKLTTNQLPASTPDTNAQAVLPADEQNSALPSAAKPFSNKEISDSVSFAEPLIALAVKKSLGIPKEDPVLTDDLKKIRKLYIWYAEAAADLQEYFDLSSSHNYTEPGSVISLEDLTMMPNLTHISVCGQEELRDISPLAKLENIESLELINNPIRDLSPLANMQYLSYVCVLETQVVDLSPLISCPAVEFLRISEIPCRDFSPLAQMPKLTNLEAIGLPIADVLPYFADRRLYNLSVSEIPDKQQLTAVRALQSIQLCDDSIIEIETLADILEEITSLEKVILDCPDVYDLTPLLKLDQLQQLEVSRKMRIAAEELEGEAPFEIIFS